MAAALLFWGAHTGLLPVAVAVAALLEGSRLIRARWTFSHADFDRISNICMTLFLGTAVYLFFSEGTISWNDFFADAGRRPEAIREKGRAALLLIQWLPMLFLPLIAAQVFSATNSVDAATFSWILRRWRREGEREGVNLSFAYLGVCLLAASASNRRSPWFFAGLALVIAWALWSQRSRRFPAGVWVGLFLVAVAGGYGGHIGLARLQAMLEQMNVPWFSKFAALNINAKQTRTMIGSIGRLKLSDRIVLRVRTDGQPPPDLLREASYNLYRGGIWLNLGKEFTSVASESNYTSWVVASNPAPRAVTIGKYLSRGGGILPLPLATAVLDELPYGNLEKNAFGVVRVSGGPGLAIYTARYGDIAAMDAAPTREDRHVQDLEQATIARVADAIGLQPGMRARAAMARVEQFFASNFTYSSYLDGSHRNLSNETALARFLLKNRSGHCEYFATATVLLLRQAGVPARYAIGYAVEEGKGNKYVVRERHAHAWTLVYYDNAWHDFDTTPASWNAVEMQHASWFLPVKDFFSEIWFQFSKWRWSSIEWRKYFIWAPVPLLVVALAMFYLKRQWRSAPRGPGKGSATQAWPGLDSELYLIEREFAARGFGRHPSESWRRWLRRITESTAEVGPLPDIITLHYRYRFDPSGLDATQRNALRTEVNAYLSAQRQKR